MGPDLGQERGAPKSLVPDDAGPRAVNCLDNSAKAKLNPERSRSKKRLIRQIRAAPLIRPIAVTNFPAMVYVRNEEAHEALKKSNLS